MAGLEDQPVPGKFPPGILLVASIDLGTTFSGYAFTMQKDPGRVFGSAWRGNSMKAPTTLLLTPNKTFKAFGFEADDKYTQLIFEEDHRGWFYFKNFKMELYDKRDGQRLTRDTQLADIEGKRVPAMHVFSCVIRYLKGHLLERVRSSSGNIDEHEILWVLTVPAIWSDAAKQFMREAARKAGIKLQRQLKIMLEPEAASVYCQSDFTRKATERGSVARLEHFEVGHMYLVADLGGGTGDLAVHEILEGGKLRELQRAKGGELGGNRVNFAFEIYLRKLLTDEVFDYFKEHERGDYMDLFAEFELKKQEVHFERSEPLLLKLPPSLGECLQRLRRITFQKCIEEDRSTNLVEVSKGKIKINSNLMKVFFGEPVSEIIKVLKNIIQLQKFRINTLLLVGGFAESPYVYERVKDEISKDCDGIEILRPQDAKLHVLKGAVVSVVNDAKIVERVAGATYGFRVKQPFSDKYPEFLRDADGMCSEAFLKIITLDETLKFGEKKSYEFKSQKLPHQKEDEVCMDFVKCDVAEPVHCKEVGCQIVASVKIKPPRSGWPNAVVFRVDVEIQESQFHITCINGTDGKMFETDVDFLV